MEIEIKFKCNKSFSTIKASLIKQGFSLSKRGDQADYYFIVGKKGPNNSKDYLRIREDRLKKKTSLDYHRAISELETEEFEVDVSDKNTMQKILILLNQKLICTVEKRREEYKKGNVCVVLDEVKNLGKFIEIEIIGESTAKNKKLLEKTAADLGLDIKDKEVHGGYPDMLLKK